MNIGDAAEATGLPPKTIRYYEQVSLVVPERSANGYRAYSAADVHKLAFVGRARDLGFPLEECRALLALWDDTARRSGDVRRLARDHLARIEGKIADLERMRGALAHLVAACAGDDRPDCPILTDLEGVRR